MRSALRGLNETLQLACPVTWPAAKACHAWGAPGAHGCAKKPGHSGKCQCACGRFLYGTPTPENVEEPDGSPE